MLFNTFYVLIIFQVGKKRLYQTTSKPLGNLNLQFNQASAIPTSVNISLSRFDFSLSLNLTCIN